MKKMFRKDKRAVSPVIATILMVAITVVLAAVLYVMVARFIVTPPPVEKMGITIGRSPNGENWIVSVTSTPSGQAAGATYLSIYTPGGSAATACDGVSFSDLNYTINGAEFDGGATIKAGDRILVDVDVYGDGYAFQIASADAVLAEGELGGF